LLIRLWKLFYRVFLVVGQNVYQALCRSGSGDIGFGLHPGLFIPVTTSCACVAFLQNPHLLDILSPLIAIDI
jgi:hypothetical protein